MRITMWMIRDPDGVTLHHLGAHQFASDAWAALGRDRGAHASFGWEKRMKDKGWRAVRVTVTDYTTARALLAETHTEDGC